jgi:hypothetical protein
MCGVLCLIKIYEVVLKGISNELSANENNKN